MSKFMNDEFRKIRDALKCEHCGVIFQGTDSQARHVKYEEKVVYCTPVCRRAASSEKARQQALNEGKKLRKGILNGPCPTCGKMYESHIDKMFCSLKCYNASPKFKEMLLANYKKGSERTQEIWAVKMKRVCPVCGKEFRAVRSHRKFCSHLCYRKFRADLFDAWIANPQQIALPQCYDEFMLQDELPCLVDGCQWKGRNLSVHLNVGHGIKAADFKRAAGFNLKTGLISPDLFAQLSERNKVGVAINVQLQQKGKDALKNGFMPNSYHSLEGKEHARKARMMLGHGPERECIGCGIKFKQSTPCGRTLYCTISCRDQTYSEANKGKWKQG
jgi:endogenous inhibitor of DNA gyrase (YacG/DUF329 family)